MADDPLLVALPEEDNDLEEQDDGRHHEAHRQRLRIRRNHQEENRELRPKESPAPQPRVINDMPRKNLRARRPTKHQPTGVDADLFKQLGGEIMSRFDVESSSFETRWPSFFAVHASILAIVFGMIHPWIEEEDDLPSLQPCHILWAVLFLTQYTNEADLASKCGGVDEDTF